MLAALGGAANERSVATAASRLRIGIEDVTRLDRTALGAMGLRGVALPRPDCVHLIVGPQAEAAAAALRQLLSDRPMVPDPHDAAVQASPGGHS